jgi:hypothetical protein
MMAGHQLKGAFKTIGRMSGKFTGPELGQISVKI